MNTSEGKLRLNILETKLKGKGSDICRGVVVDIFCKGCRIWSCHAGVKKVDCRKDSQRVDVTGKNGRDRARWRQVTHCGTKKNKKMKKGYQAFHHYG